MARVSGEPMFNGIVLEILPVKVIEGDVHGTLRFQGSLMVTGNIGRARQTLHPGISLFMAELRRRLRSVRGDIYLSGAESKTHRLFCISDLAARELIKSRVNCGGNVSVGNSIINSQLEVEKNVLAEGGSGQIAGGTLRCGGIVSAKSIGSRLGLDTVLEVGVLPS